MADGCVTGLQGVDLHEYVLGYAESGGITVEKKYNGEVNHSTKSALHRIV